MLDWLIQAARATLAQPGPAFRQLLDQRFAPVLVWQSAVLVAILLVGINLLTGTPPADLCPEGMPDPLLQFALQLVFLVLPAGMMQAVGRAFGRQADLTDCLLAVLWVQVVVLPLQIVFALTLYRAPALAGGMALAMTVMILWLLTVFIAELFAYTSRARVFMGLLAATLTISLIAQALLPPGMI